MESSFRLTHSSRRYVAGYMEYRYWCSYLATDHTWISTPDTLPYGGHCVRNVLSAANYFVIEFNDHSMGAIQCFVI